MIEYVLGFAMYEGRVWLIRKARPAEQAGKLNGIGGKVEPGEHPDEAMVREFKEEAGAVVENWIQFGELTDNENYHVTIYRRDLTEEEDKEVQVFAWCSDIDNLDRDEPIYGPRISEVLKMDDLPYEVLSNLRLLLHAALLNKTHGAELVLYQT